MFTSPLEVFVYYALPMLILTVGLCGNLIALRVLEDKKLKKIGPLFMYRLMFVLDSLFLLCIFVIFFAKGFQLSLYLISELSCKLFFYIGQSAAFYSPLILVYISLDRVFSLKYYSKRLLLKKFIFQYIFVLFFVTFNYFYYVPVFLNYKLSSNKTECYLFGSNPEIVIYMNIVYLLVLFSVILVLSFFLIYLIFASHQRAESNYTKKQNRQFKKDLRMAISSVCFNFLYIFLLTPFTVIYYFFTQIDDITYTAAEYLVFFAYAINFYILIVTNFHFRKKFVLTFFKQTHTLTHRDQIHRVFYVNQNNGETVNFFN